MRHRLTDDAGALARVARQALVLCHFDPITGNDLKGVEGAEEGCEAACYDCLLSYYNQWDHRIVDRKLIKNLLMQLKEARVLLSSAVISREEHLEQLLRLTDSNLEKDWLSFLETHHLNLPTAAQKLIESCRTRPDFWFDLNNRRTAVYIDGPVHLYPDRQARDRKQEECLEDMGIRVIRFGHDDDWESIVKRYPDIFGDWANILAWHECCFQWANALLSAGVTFILMPNSFCNPCIVTREIATKITIPILKDAFSKVNGPLVVHSGGAPLVPFLDLYAQLPNVRAIVVNGEESLAKAREKIGAQQTLIGNLDGSALWKRESKDIKTECLEILRERCNDPHFILGSCGPDIAFDTPLENIKAIGEALEIFTEG